MPNLLEKIISGITSYRDNPEGIKKKMEAYYNKLLKASVYLSIVPIILIVILIVYERLSFTEGIALSICVFFGSMIFAKPYLDDLSALTNYVNSLSQAKDPEPPSLGYISNVEQVSKSIANLNSTWFNKTLELKTALAESSILFDIIPDILIMVDKNLSIVRANNAAINFFKKSISSEHLKDIFSDDLLIEKVLGVSNGNNSDKGETRLLLNNQYYDFNVRIEKFPINSDMGVSSVIVMRDITDEKRRKQLLKDFIANASHEIRTPLTSIIGFIENLETLDIVEKDAENRRRLRKKFLGIISDQALKMSSLLGDLISLSKAEMSQTNDNLTNNIDINKIIHEVSKRLFHSAEKKRIKIRLNLTQETGELRGNYIEMSQVFTNILSNAIKYGSENSEITIKSKMVENSLHTKNIPDGCKKLLLISITDQGEGISHEHLPRLTERFYRVDRIRSKKVEGTGLGLAIVKHILSKHDCKLIIESKLGVGSTFTVCLPVY